MKDVEMRYTLIGPMFAHQVKCDWCKVKQTVEINKDPLATDRYPVHWVRIMVASDNRTRDYNYGSIIIDSVKTFDLCTKCAEEKGLANFHKYDPQYDRS